MAQSACLRWMLQHKGRLSGVFVAFLMVACFVWLCGPGSGIGPISFYRIRAGMSVEQVEGIIGLRPGYYHWWNGCGGFASSPYVASCKERGIPWEEVSAEWRHRSNGRRNDPTQTQGCAKWWYSADYAITVAFDESGQAVAWKLEEIDNRFIEWRQPGLLDRLQDWLRSLGL